MRPKRIVAISSPCCRELAVERPLDRPRQHGRSGIFTTCLVDFLRRVLIEANARSHPRREVAAQAGLR